MKFLQRSLLTLCVSSVLACVSMPCLFAQAAKPAAAAKPDPDELIFTNGDHLSGSLVRVTGGSVVFKSSMAGELTVAVDKIRELRSATEFVVLRKDAPIVTKVPPATGTLLLSDGSIELSPKSGPAVTIPAKEAAYVIDDTTYTKQINRHAGFLEGWSGAATAGFTLVRSTTNGETFTGGLNLVRAIPSVPYLPKRNRTTIDVNETYGSLSTPVIPPTVPATPASTVKTNIFHADAERDEYLNNRFYLLGDASFDHNYSQGLNLQQIYGAGAGYTAIQNGRQQLDLHADAHYERQNFFVAANNQNLIGATFGEVYRLNLPAKIVFTENGDFIPAFNNSNAYAANFNAALALPVYKRIGANLSVIDNYLNDPAPFYNKNSFQFVTGITYTIH